jgi:2-dehydropantoate 2-reductase
MFRRDDVLKLSRAYLAECLAVARAAGADRSHDVIAHILMRMQDAPPNIAASMLSDREARRPLEWDVRNGVNPA